MKYFRSYQDASAYCKNNDLHGKPLKVNVWLDMSWTKVWAVKIPATTLGKELP